MNTVNRRLLYLTCGLLCVLSMIPFRPVSAQTAGWQLKATLIPKGWTAATKGFLGWSLAIDGDTLVAGAPAKNNSVGAVEVIVRAAGDWAWQTELVAKDGKPNDDFGWAVAIQGDMILVGAPYKDKFAGHVYLFQRTGTAWAQQDFPQPKGIKPGDLLGWSLAFVRSAPVNSPATPAAIQQAGLLTDSFKIVAASSPKLREQVQPGTLVVLGAPGAGQDAGKLYQEQLRGPTWEELQEGDRLLHEPGDFFPGRFF